MIYRKKVNLPSIIFVYIGKEKLGNNLTDEKELVARLKQGDENALEILMYKYTEKVYGIAFNIVRNQQLAEEICQDAFLKIYYNIKNFKEESSLTTYFFKIVINCARDKYRQEKNINTVPEEFYNLESVGSNPEEEIINKETNKKIYTYINNLPLRQKEILLLKIKEDLKIKEIAKILNITEGAVKANLFKAVQNLKNILKREEVNGS